MNFPVNVATAPTKHLNPGSSLRLLLSMPRDSTQRIESGPVAKTVYVEMPEGAGIFSSRLPATHTKKRKGGCTFCNVQLVRLYGLQLNLRNKRNAETITEEVIFSNIPKYEFRKIFLSGSVTYIINL